MTAFLLGPGAMATGRHLGARGRGAARAGRRGPRAGPERLGVTPEEMDGGHLPALARPQELADRLAGLAQG